MEEQKKLLNLSEVKKEVKTQTIGYILAALGFVAGLAWNEAIKGLIDYFFPISNNSLPARFIYAILITVIIVIVSYKLVKYSKK